MWNNTGTKPFRSNKVNSEVDIYNSQSGEALLFDDGIQVKSQKKPER